MKTSILKKIGSGLQRTLEQRLLTHGSILDVRVWPGSKFAEIDLHLPEAQMTGWKEVPYIKLLIKGLSFRDYTPFGWDAATSTCSLLIDTAHEGVGCHWAHNLQVGDGVEYLKIDSTHQYPHPKDKIIGIGDHSSLAHLLALKQLTGPDSRFNGFVISDDIQAGKLFNNYYPQSSIRFLNASTLRKELKTLDNGKETTSFYLTGNNNLVTELRKTLRENGYDQIKVKGFWD